MGFLDNAVDKLGAKVADGAWVDSGAKKLRGEVVNKLPTEYQGNANQAVDRIVAGKSALATTSLGTFTKVVGYAGLGLVDEAKLAWLREQATFEDRMAARRASIGISYNADAERAKAWEEVKAVALDVVKYAGPIALQLLLAMA